jgi:hypothetical protein
MQSKSLLIAVAAFAVTATGVHAYGGSTMLNRAGLTKDQAAAIEEAQELRATGDFVAARDKLAAAGITEETLQAMHKASKQTRSAVQEAIAAGDYLAFKAAAADSPLADIVTTKEDFQQLVEVHELRRIGQLEATLNPADPGAGRKHGLPANRQSAVWEELSDEQHEALRVARQANDRATIQAIIDEAGITGYPLRG